MAIEKIRLADGTEINVEEWLRWPLFSSGLGQGNVNGVAPFVGAGGQLRLFEYVVGDNLPSLGTPAGAPFQAGVTDTNQVVRGKINHDEGFICFNLTYEPFALDRDPAYGDQVDDTISAPQPMLSGTNLRRLQTQMLLEMTVGAGITKPRVSAPLEYYGQHIGPTVATSGDALTQVGPAPVNNIALDFGTGGPVSPHNTRRWHLPVKIDANRDMFVALRSPEGEIIGMDQDWRIRVYMDGLKRRPVA